MVKECSLMEILDSLSSESATPGGGTVAGIAGAIASSLLSMVCNLTIGKKKYQSVEDEIKKYLAESEKLKLEFIALAEKDTEVFNEVMEAYQLPHGDEEEQAERKKAIEETTKRAALVPMDILKRCETIARLCVSVASKGNENSISDVGVASIMATAAAQSAALNILINLSTISDDDFISKLKTEQSIVIKTIKDLADETNQIVQEKL
jgi:formiminotetrahydrofolate cyclodeaminase